MSAIITGIITALTTLVVCMANNYYANKRQETAQKAQHREIVSKQEESMTVIKMQIENLAKQVEKHNKVVERTYKLEQNTSVLAEQIKVANHRIGDLERKEERND